MTNFWEQFSDEYQQGKNLVDAVANANVAHFLASTLSQVQKISKLSSLHIKAQLEEYARLRAYFLSKMEGGKIIY